jgi:hypothetical protein
MSEEHYRESEGMSEKIAQLEASNIQINAEKENYENQLNAIKEEREKYEMIG